MINNIIIITIVIFFYVRFSNKYCVLYNILFYTPTVYNKIQASTPYTKLL